MPRPILLISLALVACSDASEKAEPVAVTASSLVGLYERAGAGPTPDRICMTGQGSDTRFGLVTRSAGLATCTAEGTVARNGYALTLAIDGAPSCTLRATTTARGLTLAAPEGAECAYYCGAGAELAPGDFAKVGGTEADARRTVDVAGEPVC